MAGIIDKDKEIARLHEEIEQLDHDIQRISNKLNNDGFIVKAPASVVEKEQKKMAAFEQKQMKMKKQLKAIEAL
tara:strand:- start:1721 stop:1942 length:222 start_codon:yes stop_codon:yes gene_type:complete